MTAPVTAPAESVRLLIDQADAALHAYKAAKAEEDQGKADAAFAEFERIDGEARKALEDARRSNAGDQFAAYKAALSVSAGRLPVGGTMPAEDAEVSIPFVAKGKPGKFTPEKSLTRGWTAKAEADYTSAFRRFLAGQAGEEDRAASVQKGLSAGVDTAGGFWVAPEVFASEVITALEDLVLMRQLGTVMPSIPAGTSVKIRVASDLQDASWTTELATATADTATPAGQRALTPHDLAKLVKASNTFLSAFPGGEAYIRDEIANRFAEAEESAFMTGTGAGQPQGVFSANSTLPTDVTAASATVIAYADLLGVEASLKAQYRPGASWIMHRTIYSELMALNDGVGVPLLRRDPAAAWQFNLFGYPVNLSEYAPSSSATGLYVGALGNWKRAYRIVDSLGMTIQRLVELYAATNETGFIARKSTDGMIVDGNGIVRLKMA